MAEMEEKNLMNSQIYNSVWQAHKHIEGEEEVIYGSSSASKEELGLEGEEDEY